MPTTITKTIKVGGVGADYATLQAWADDTAAIPVDLTAGGGFIAVGECLSGGGEFTSASTLLSLSGHTTDATHYIKLTAAAGNSFRDNAGVRSNALYYNAANGVGVQVTGGYSVAITINNSNVQITRLQVKSFAASNAVVWTFGNTGCLLEDCIVEAGGGSIPAVAIGAGTVRNCLVVWLSGGNDALRVIGNVSLYGVTVVRPGSASGSGVGAFYGTAVLKDCCIFNFTTAFTNVGGGGNMTGSDYNATDAASLPAGSNNTYNLTFADQFVSSTNDFRAASAGGLHVGVADAVNLPTDITGLARGATPWVGAWEVSGSGPASSSPSPSPSARPPSPSPSARPSVAPSASPSPSATSITPALPTGRGTILRSTIIIGAV